MMQFLVVLVALFAAASAQIVSVGQCDNNVTVQQNFDIPAYGGVWNEIYRYGSEFQPNGDCVTATYTLNEYGNVTVFNRMVVMGTEFTINGTAAPTVPENNEGKLLVNFPTAANEFSDYWVLTSDYKGYSLVYACTNLANNNKRVSSWVLSRTTTLSPQAVISMEPWMESVSGLSWDNYRLTSQAPASCLLYP